MQVLGYHAIHYVSGSSVVEQSDNALMLSCGIGAISPNPIAAMLSVSICSISYIFRLIGA